MFDIQNALSYDINRETGKNISRESAGDRESTWGQREYMKAGIDFNAWGRAEYMGTGRVQGNR